MPDNPKPAKNHGFRQQLEFSALGELSGYAVSIGAVYAAESLCPVQTHALIERLAGRLGAWRGTGQAAQRELARKITDVALMNIGGLVNMSTQFCLHRQAQSAEERAPLVHDLGRVLSGRIAGTVTSIGTLALAETYRPALMTRSSESLAPLLGNRPRLAGLALSNLVQGAGALVGSVPAQLLYDRLAGAGKSRT